MHERAGELGVASHGIDITDWGAVRATIGGLGRLDVLVNNAGVELVTPILDRSDAVDHDFAGPSSST